MEKRYKVEFGEMLRGRSIPGNWEPVDFESCGIDIQNDFGSVAEALQAFENSVDPYDFVYMRKGRRGRAFFYDDMSCYFRIAAATAEGGAE